MSAYWKHNKQRVTKA